MEAKASVQKQIIRELQILHDCHSPAIVGYFGSFLNQGDISICMEYMECGSLDSILHKKGCFPESIVGKVSIAVLQGLIYLFEQHRIIHRGAYF